MTAVVVPFSSEKTVFRRILTPVPGNNFAAETRKRFENHERWIREKDYAIQLQKENRRKAEEAAKREQARLKEEERRREYVNQIQVKQWQNNKNKDKVRKRQESLVLSLITSKDSGNEEIDGKQLYQNWIQLKSEQKDRERKQLEEKQKREEQRREVRKTLAEICYEQWNEAAKCRSLVLPKNGFEIFGPKPKPVVLEEWVGYEPPQETRSLHTMGNSKLYTIPSFRSERLFSENDSQRSGISRLQLDRSNWSLVPWAQSQGFQARRTPLSSAKSTSTKQSKQKQAPKKKKPPFR